MRYTNALQRLVAEARYGSNVALQPFSQETPTPRFYEPSVGADEGNRTPVVSLGSFCSAIELRPHRVLFNTSVMPGEQTRISSIGTGPELTGITSVFVLTISISIKMLQHQIILDSSGLICEG